MDQSACCSRRSFLGCGAYVVGAVAAAGPAARRVFAREAAPVAAKAPFARIEKLADRVWALVSTPMDAAGQIHPQTFSNGAIIAGKDAVLAVEGFNTPVGSAWLSDAALELAGRRPTHVVLTHFHPDHSAGLAGYQRGKEGPAILASKKTRELLLEKLFPALPEGDGKVARSGRRLLLPDTVLLDETTPHEIDLGGRTVRIASRSGHTPSDVTIEIDAPRIVWCGDLYFEGLFPYYGDAIPSQLDKSIAALHESAFDLYVPGHGPVSEKSDLERYARLLAHVGEAARKAVEAGTPADKAWQAYKIPAALGEWRFFRPDVTRFAFAAWERELK